MQKYYEVFVINPDFEWKYIGVFDQLQDAVPEINQYIEQFEGFDPLNPEDLTEYPSTFSAAFDRYIYSRDESEEIGIRGFIFYEDDFVIDK